MKRTTQSTAGYFIALSLLCCIAGNAAASEAVAQRVESLAAWEETLAQRMSQANPWRQEATGAHISMRGTGYAPLRTHLPLHAQHPLTLRNKGAVVHFTPLNANPSLLECAGKYAVYQNVYHSTDSILLASEAWMEQFWLLRGPQAPHRFTFEVTLESGVHEVLAAEDGSLAFLAQDGSEVLRMPPPFAIDATGRRIEATVEWDGQQLRMALAAPTAMAYPVLVDPAIEAPVWRQLTTPEADNAPPAPFTPHAMATLNDKIVLFAGDSGEANNETWVWDGSAWEDKTPENPTAENYPSWRLGHSLVTLKGKVVLFGGLMVDRNAIKDTGPVLVDPRTLPDNALTYLNDTWVWDGTAWANMTPQSPTQDNTPSLRTNYAMAALGEKVVLFGGTNNFKANGLLQLTTAVLNDTWEWNGSSWENKTPETIDNNPPKLLAHAMAALGNKIVLFGGLAFGLRATQDSWTWDGSTWAKVTTPTSATSPSARAFHAMVTLGNEIVLFGGLPESNDTWTWDGSAWKNASSSKPSSTNTPPKGFGYSMAKLKDKVLLFGGVNTNGTVFSSMWDWPNTDTSTPETANTNTTGKSESSEQDENGKQAGCGCTTAGEASLAFALGIMTFLYRRRRYSAM